jgi:hypothetical protein
MPTRDSREKGVMGWGWLTYHRTGWINEHEVPIIEAVFSTDPGPAGYTEARILLCTRHPIRALRAICRTGRHPTDFHGKEVLP